MPDSGLSDVVVSGEATAEAEHDHTVHVDVTDLEPGAIYHYGFSAAGEDSPVGRTWTLRADAERLRFATCSCAKHNAGFFNAYARIAELTSKIFLARTIVARVLKPAWSVKMSLPGTPALISASRIVSGSS